jgi:hypothetical protein
MSSLRDQHLGQRIETGVAPLFSPQSYALEAVASAAPALLFTESQRAAIQRDLLFPLAGFDPSEASRYVAINRLVEALDATIFAVTTRYLTGQLDAAGAAAALHSQAAMADTDATLRFIDSYRAYSTAYTQGRLLAMTAFGSPADRPEHRWRRFVDITLAGRLPVSANATDTQ